MNINEILDIAEQFFSIKHPNFCDDYVEVQNYYIDTHEFLEMREMFIQNIENQLWKICEEFFQQMRPDF